MTDLSEREAARAIIIGDLQILAFDWEGGGISSEARATLSGCIDRIKNIDLTQEQLGITSYGPLIRAWRIERGLLLVEMADKLGIKHPDLLCYEMGSKDVPEDIALKIEAMMFPNGPAAHHAKQDAEEA